ncbi:response regulator transcription factor [Vibrio crassostreae]|uniref:response regulator transcription factor n=1 Tax=Vibrio crassostreae TaxID=246167 RepID=UPI001B30A432|nr:response regulator transcription factor [Vibrio crassostreae]CAK3514117.1 Response regulator transcription factor [Vibrio crassostreae]CAK3514900.1 Response regulator transcription factor [Vibrio crassostreae]CAK3912074.1 Response regulator transcription factor [Vibrio crassostreae]
MNLFNTLIVDNQPIVRNALITILENNKISSNIHEANSIKEATTYVRTESIDLILLDVNLQDGNGLDFVRRIIKGGFKGKVLFISSDEHPFINKSAKEIGASGYISKKEDPSLIKDAIVATTRGYSVFKQILSVNNTPDLSMRESVVFSYLSKGYSNKEISELLSLSSKTISTYKTRILDKYNSSSIIEILALPKN